MLRRPCGSRLRAIVAAVALVNPAANHATRKRHESVVLFFSFRFISRWPATSQGQKAIQMPAPLIRPCSVILRRRKTHFEKSHVAANDDGVVLRAAPVSYSIAPDDARRRDETLSLEPSSPLIGRPWKAAAARRISAGNLVTS